MSIIKVVKFLVTRNTLIALLRRLVTTSGIEKTYKITSPTPVGNARTLSKSRLQKIIMASCSIEETIYLPYLDGIVI